MFEIPSNFAYLFLTIPFLLIWLVLYLGKKSTHREQLHMSIIGALIGPLSEIIYFRDYWLPKSIFNIYIGNFPFMIEDVLFGFAIGGIGAVIFEVIFKTKLRKISIHSKYILNSWSILFIFATSLFLFQRLGLNSIYSSSLAFLFSGLPILIKRSDLFINAFGSGVAVMFTMFISYFVLFNLVSNTELLMKEQWLIYSTSLDARFAGIPLTEMVWGFTWGFFAGPLYEFLSNKKTIY